MNNASIKNMDQFITILIELDYDSLIHAADKVKVALPRRVTRHVSKSSTFVVQIFILVKII